MERQLEIYGDQISRMLNVQYRMHRDIMTFSSDQFYGGELVADPTVVEHVLPDRIP